jgi:hypothetical protein
MTENIEYILDRLFLLLSFVDGVLVVGGLYSAAVWLAVPTILIGIGDVILHFKFYADLLAWCGFLVCAAILVALCSYFNRLIERQHQEAQETETHGWLIPSNDPTPPIACIDSLQPPPEALIFLLGGNVIWTLQKNFSPVRIGDCTTLNVVKSDHGLLVSGDIFAEDGKLVAHVRNNEFKLASSEVSYTERTDDLSTLIVHDPAGQEVLYVRYMNPQMIDIRGRFYCHGLSVIVTPDRQVIEGTNSVNYNCLGRPRVGFDFFLTPNGSPTFSLGLMEGEHFRLASSR